MKEYTFRAIFEEPEVTIEAETYDEALEEATEELEREYSSWRCPAILEVRDAR